MTKKIFCLLLCAFLGVSLIALFAACRGGGDTQEPTAQSTTLSADEQDSTAVFSLEVPTADTEE